MIGYERVLSRIFGKDEEMRFLDAFKKVLQRLGLLESDVDFMMAWQEANEL